LGRNYSNLSSKSSSLEKPLERFSRVAGNPVPLGFKLFSWNPHCQGLAIPVSFFWEQMLGTVMTYRSYV
jgi:hypothetical protein